MIAGVNTILIINSIKKFNPARLTSIYRIIGCPPDHSYNVLLNIVSIPQTNIDVLTIGANIAVSIVEKNFLLALMILFLVKAV